MTRFMSSLVPMCLLGLLTATSCTRPRTQIMARFVTNMSQGPSGQLRAIRVQVTGEKASEVHYDQTLQLGPGGFSLPQELGLVPGRNKSGLVTVQVDALGASNDVLFTKHVSARYREQKTLLLEIYLAARCLDAAANTCPSAQSCGAAGCEEDLRENLPEYTAGNDDMGIAMNDLATSDLSTPPVPDLFGADLFGADLTVVPDLSPPDDLITLPDFSSFDLSGAPVITSVSPDTVVAGVSSLTINGMRLTGNETVTIGGVAQTVTASSATQLTIAQVNAATTIGTGVAVVVMTDGGPGQATVTVVPRFAIASVTSTSPTQMEITFNRAPLASSVQAADFTLAGLTISNASVAGSVVTLTTSTMIDATQYLLSWTENINDMIGGQIVAGFRPVSGPMPTEFVIAAVTNTGAVTGQIELQRRSIATPGTVVSSIVFPSAETTPFTTTGNGSAEGVLTRSPNGKQVSLVGYRVMAGVASPSDTATRGLAVVDNADFVAGSATNVDFSIALTTGANGAGTSIFGIGRASSAVVNGDDIWAVGGGGGIFHGTFSGNGAFSSIASSPSTGRQVAIWGGQLYFTSSNTGSLAVHKVGTGLPTSTATATPMDGAMIGAAFTPFGFSIFDVDPNEAGPDLVYTFDDGAAPSSTAGIKRFVKASGTWTNTATFSSSAGAPRHGVCYFDQTDVVCLVSSSAAMLTLRDVNHASASSAGIMSTGVAPPSGTGFRGLTFAPQP